MFWCSFTFKLQSLELLFECEISWGAELAVIKNTSKLSSIDQCVTTAYNLAKLLINFKKPCKQREKIIKEIPFGGVLFGYKLFKAPCSHIDFFYTSILSASPSGATIKRHSTLCIQRVNHLIDHIAIHSIYSRIQKYENKLHTLWIFSQRWIIKESSGEHKYTAQLNIFQQIPIILLIFLTPHSLFDHSMELNLSSSLTRSSFAR